MQSQTWIDAVLAMPWIAWSVGGVLIALGLFLLWLFLFSDRARGRRRCPKCWYDLRGTPGLRCSECGFEARRERALFRTRRRWRAGTIAAAVLLCGIGLTIAPNVRNDGWASLVPTTALLWLLPLGNDPSSLGNQHWTERELDRRDAAASLADWQWRYLLLHKDGLRFRRTWPADTPLVLESRWANWGGFWSARIETAESEQLPGWDSLLPGGIRTELPRPQVGPSTTLEVVIKQSGVYRYLPQLQPRPKRPVLTEFTWNGKVELPIRVVPTIDDAMTRRSGPEFDQLLRKAIQVQIAPGFSTGRGGGLIFGGGDDGNQEPDGSVFFTIVLDRSVDPRLRNLAFGFRASFRKRDEMIRAAEAALRYERSYRHTIWPREGDLSASIEQSTAPPMSDLTSSDYWVVELRGVPKQALFDWDRNEYWDGVIELGSNEVWIEGRDAAETQRGRELLRKFKPSRWFGR